MVSEEVLQAVDLAIQQVQIFFVLLARPIVQRELIALIAIFLFSWMVSVILRGWYERRSRMAKRAEASAGRQSLKHSIFLLLAPILALVLLNLVERVFVKQGYPAGLIAGFEPLAWAWLFYRTLLAFLYHRFGAAMRPFHHWVFMPLFLWLVATRLLDNFVSLRPLASIPLFSLFGTPMTVRNLTAALLAIYWFIVAAWLVQVSVRRLLASRPSVEAGVVESVVTISRYVVLAIGFLLALHLLGIDLSTLALIGGALSVGVGFGLQSIVASFISGIVLLFEQSLLPGDVIDVNGGIGTVEKVNIRSTTVRTNDNVEVVIPNDLFLTSEVTTFTKTNNRIRIQLPFGVSYASSPHRVKEVAQSVAAKHDRVLAEPAPHLFFRGFGDSSLDFQLAVWIEQPEHAKVIESDLYYMLWDAFEEHGIEIPFPQRDLNLGRGWTEVLAVS